MAKQTEVSIEVVMNNPEELDYIIMKAKQELIAWTKRYKQYKDLKVTIDSVQLIIDEF